MPEQARQAMAEHVNASLNFTIMSGTGSDPFSVFSEHGR
jgi:4-diphosphocytidyl-2C-methyl-D-erythritol kinase